MKRLTLLAVVAVLFAAPAGAAPTACVGDCAGDGEVSIVDLIVGVNIATGFTEIGRCASFDPDGDGQVTIDNLLLGVNAALDGCPVDPRACEIVAADGLRDCIEDLNATERDCFLEDGGACAPDDAAVTAVLDLLENVVLAACPDDATVRDSGYGAAATREGLVNRLAASCRAETASLASRTFGGPQGVALAAGTAGAVACLTATHEAGSELLRTEAALYGDCILSDTCDPAVTTEAAETLEASLAAEVAAACGELETRIAVSADTYASRAGAQARCVAAIAHPDTTPLTLDCGPRDGLAATPRGEYVQIVLDGDTYGTRCGDGSDFAFWVRLAPQGKPTSNVVVGMQGGGVCIFGEDCATRPAGLFEALSDQPETTGPMSNDPEVSPFADWTKVYLPYCNQDVFIGGGATSNFPEITVHRYGAVNVRAALRYVRDLIWRDLNATTTDGYRPDELRVLFGGFSAGGFGTLYNYHWVLDDLQWAHTAAYPDAALALDNGGPISIAALGVLLISDVPPLGWDALDYLPPYCFANDCGVGPVLLEATAPRLKAVPEQQFLILSNQVDETQVSTTFFADTPTWINALRRDYCATRDLNGVQYFMPAIPADVHVISPRNELYTGRAVDGVIMRDWLASGFSDPDAVTDQVEEGTLVDAYPGVAPFDCEVAP